MWPLHVCVDVLVADVACHERAALLCGARAAHARGHLVLPDHTVGDRVLHMLPSITLGVKSGEAAIAEHIIAIVAD